MIGSSGRGFKLRRSPFGPIQNGTNLIQFDKINLSYLLAARRRANARLRAARWFSRLALGLSVLVSIRIYRFLLHFADLYMGVQVLCRPPDVGPPTNHGEGSLLVFKGTTHVFLQALCHQQGDDSLSGLRSSEWDRSRSSR